MRTAAQRRKYYRDYYKRTKKVYRARQQKWIDANRDKYKATHRKSVAKHRKAVRDFIDSLKDIPCKDCSIKYPPYCMDFDHVRGKKNFTIASYMGARKFGKVGTIAAISKEAQKCEVVCAICHRKRTQRRIVQCKSRRKQ